MIKQLSESLPILYPFKQPTMPPCPPALQDRAKILFWNSLYGYQSPSTGVRGEVFAICWCKELDSNQIDAIKNVSGSTTLICDSWLGRDFLTICWTEYSKIENIFNALLSLGFSFSTLNNCCVRFDAAVDHVFTNEIMEKKAIEHQKESMSVMEWYFKSVLFKEIYLDIWNYITPEGREFCNWLRAKKQLPPGDYNHADNYFNWPQFRNYDRTTLQSQPEVEPAKPDLEKQSQPDPEDSLCMICLDKEANTMVLPCNHCVVCKECSIQLRTTNDHHTCVQCRRAITNILEN